MRRSALLLLTLQLAAGSVRAQTPSLEVHQGNQVMTYSANYSNTNHQAASEPVAESLVTFDPQRADVVWSQNRWQLVADAHVLKDFGRREVEARQALRLVRELQLNQHGTVGSPEPVMEYWLSYGHAPYGTTAGLRILPIDLATLRVEQMQGQWCVRDVGRVLFNFRSNESEARNALAIMHKYGISQVGTLGGLGTSMMIMLSRFDAGNETEANLPHLQQKSPVRAPTQAEINAMKLKVPAGDNNLPVAQAVPPLRTSADAHKTTINEFGHQETVEVLPVGYSQQQHPAADSHVQQVNGYGHAETVEVLPGNTSTKRTAPLATELIDRMPLDWRQFQIRPEAGGQFALAAGSLVLARFNNDHDARLAMAVMQHYRFSEQDHIGRPQAYCSYFLCNGQAPRGQYLGLRTEPFHPEKLSVTLVDNRWAIVSPEKTVLLFGSKPEEARVMLDVIQRQEFDRLCHIGEEHGLTFFIRSR